MKSQGQSIVKGSMILLIANLMVKIIGAIFKIPLTNLLGNSGMGYFNSAYNIYAGLFVIATAGLPVAVSKLVSENKAVGNKAEIKRVFNASFCIFFVIGVIGTSVLFFGADWIEGFTKFEGTAPAIRAIAPAIFFVSIMSVYRGFFQGTSNMYPTAISEVAESLGKLIIGYMLAYILISIGEQQAATGAIFGVTMGTFISCAILFFIHFNNKKEIYGDNAGTPRRYREILASLLKIAIPVTISASVFSITNFIDTAMIGRNLEKIQEFLTDTPRALYGMYTGKAVVLFNFPPTLVMALCMALVPGISAAYRLKEMDKVRMSTEQSIKMTTFFAVPCAVGLFVFADVVLTILYGTTDATSVLQLITPAIVFFSIVLVTNAILQGMGHVVMPVVNILMACAVKILINQTLVSNPAVNINGAPIGTSACYFVYLLLNLGYVCKITKARFGLKFWIKPITAGVVMAAVGYFARKYAVMLVGGMESRISAIIVFICGGALSAVMYFVALFVCKGITKDDILVLPKGEKIAALLTKLGILRG